MINVDEVCRLHELVMRETGDAPERLGDAAAKRLEARLASARFWADGKDATEMAAAAGVAVLRAEAFMAGGTRAALMVTAVMLDRAGLATDLDWLAVARGLGALDYGHLEEVIAELRALLAGQPQ